MLEKLKQQEQNWQNYYPIDMKINSAIKRWKEAVRMLKTEKHLKNCQKILIWKFFSHVDATGLENT